MTAPSRCTTLLKHSLALLGYTALTLLFTYPLVVNFSTHILGDGFDSNQFPIGFWWVKKALTDLHVNPLHSDYLFYPFGTSLVFHTMTFLNGLLSIPLQTIFGLTATVNLFTLATFILSAYGAFLLVKYLSGNSYAAFLGGLIFGFCPYRLANGLGFYHTLNTQWMPFYVLFLCKLHRERRWTNGLWAGLFLLLTALNSYNYLIFLLLFTLLYLAYMFWTERQTFPSGLLKRLALCFGLFSVGFAPVLYQAYQELTRYGDYLGSDVIGTDLLHFFIPSILHPLFGEAASKLAAPLSPSLPMTIVYIGYSVLLIGLYAAVGIRGEERKPVTFWLWTAALFFLLALGPSLHINGQSYSIPLPHQLLLKVPILGGARISARFSIMLMLALAVLTGYAWVALARRLARFSALAVWGLGGLLLGLIGFEYLTFPYPNLCDQSVPEVYQQIAQDPEDVSILQIPMQFKSGNHILTVGSSDLDLFQTVHEKRLIGGYVARVPQQLMAYFERLPIISSLIHIQQGQPVSEEQIQIDKAQADAFVRFFNLKYLMVHENDKVWIGFFMRSDHREVLKRMAAYVKEVFTLQECYHEGVITAYRVNRSDAEAKSSNRIEFGTPSASLYLLDGWSPHERWLQQIPVNRLVQSGASLLMRLPPAAGQTCTLRIMPFYTHLAPQQKIRIIINDRPGPEIDVIPAWRTYSFHLPAASVRAGINRFRFEYQADASLLQSLGVRETLSPHIFFDYLECVPSQEDS